MGAVLGFQPSLQPQRLHLSAHTGPQTSSLVSKSRFKCVFLLVSEEPCVCTGDHVGEGQKCVHGSEVCELRYPVYRYECAHVNVWMVDM